MRCVRRLKTLHAKRSPQCDVDLRITQKPNGTCTQTTLTPKDLRPHEGFRNAQRVFPVRRRNTKITTLKIDKNHQHLQPCLSMKLQQSATVSYICAKHQQHAKVINTTTTSNSKHHTSSTLINNHEAQLVLMMDAELQDCIALRPHPASA